MFMIWGIILSFLQAASVAAPSLTPEHFTLDDKTGIREFYLYSPSEHPSGLVIMLHGCKTNAAEFEQGTEMSKYGALRNLAVLYPEQNVLYNFDKCWNWFWGTENEIIATGIRMVQNRYGIDRQHTYLMGMSAGAAQGAIMANCYRDLFSGALLHSGLQYLAATNLNDAQASLEHGAFTSYTQAAKIGYRCNESTAPMKFMVVYGDQDQRVNPKNSLENAQQLLELNRLLFMTSTHQQPDIQVVKTATPTSNTMLGFKESKISFNGEPIGSVILVNGLSHEWSGGNPVQPRNNPYGPKVIEKFLNQ